MYPGNELEKTGSDLKATKDIKGPRWGFEHIMAVHSNSSSCVNPRSRPLDLPMAWQLGSRKFTATVSVIERKPSMQTKTSLYMIVHYFLVVPEALLVTCRSQHLGPLVQRLTWQPLFNSTRGSSWFWIWKRTVRIRSKKDLELLPLLSADIHSICCGCCMMVHWR